MRLLALVLGVSVVAGPGIIPSGNECRPAPGINVTIGGPVALSLLATDDRNCERTSVWLLELRVLDLRIEAAGRVCDWRLHTLDGTVGVSGGGYCGGVYRPPGREDDGKMCSCGS